MLRFTSLEIIFQAEIFMFNPDFNMLKIIWILRPWLGIWSGKHVVSIFTICTYIDRFFKYIENRCRSQDGQSGTIMRQTLREIPSRLTLLFNYYCYMRLIPIIRAMTCPES